MWWGDRMPSLNIKDYIIAGLLVVILGMGIKMGYDNIDKRIMATKLTNIELEKEEAERKYKLVEKRAKQEKEEADEKYEVDTANLNSYIKRLHDSSSDLLSKSTAVARSSREITFQRDKLAEALRVYENTVTELLGEGDSCQIKLNQFHDWWYNIQSLYDRQDK